MDFEDTFPVSAEEDFPFGQTWNKDYKYAAKTTITATGSDFIEEAFVHYDFPDPEQLKSALVKMTGTILDDQVSTDVVLVAKDGAEYPCHQMFLSGNY